MLFNVSVKKTFTRAVRMLEAQQPFKRILSFFTFFGFTNRKLSIQHRIASTFVYLIFGVLFWTLIILSIIKLNENELIYFLIAPTVVGLFLKSLKLFISFKPIEDFFQFSDEIFSAKEFQPYLYRAVKRASLLTAIQLFGYTFLQSTGTLSSALDRKLSAPMITIGDKKRWFWLYWFYACPISGFYSAYLFAGFNLLPICLLLIVHEYVKYMNDFLRTVNGSNQYEKLNVFMTIQGNFKT